MRTLQLKMLNMHAIRQTKIVFLLKIKITIFYIFVNFSSIKFVLQFFLTKVANSIVLDFNNSTSNIFYDIFLRYFSQPNTDLYSKL